MSDVVIRAENLGKKYLIGHEAERERYTALRDVLARSARGLARSARDMLAGRQLVAGDEVEEFWALRDVNFEIRCGEVVGIIGRNGAGKSTLLKILSRITEPSTGRVEIRGRVASLLEVGTGFHPELTGRENIFLNGAILGMTRAEIRKKFDEIVDFAGVERFLDTPVKRYSSGMYVRLAFAVAAHLEPEILVVDEVLAVGDAEFQKKCLGKMKDVAGHGRTVLFVSHNISAVRQLCDAGILLLSGRISFIGSTVEALSIYLNGTKHLNGTFRRETPPTTDSYILSASLRGLTWSAQDSKLSLLIDFDIVSPAVRAVSIDFRIRDHHGTPTAFCTTGSLDSTKAVQLKDGINSLAAVIDLTSFAIGIYFLSIDISIPWVTFLDRANDVLCFEIGADDWHATVSPLRLDYGLGAFMTEVRVSPSG